MTKSAQKTRIITHHAKYAKKRGVSGPAQGGTAKFFAEQASEAAKRSDWAISRLFGLSPAEVKLALAIAQGRTLEDIAKVSREPLSTLRGQLAAVFTKTGTNRRAQLAALLSRISILSEGKAKLTGKKAALSQRVHGADGNLRTIYAIDAGSESFGSDLDYAFKKNVAQARQENKRTIGRTDAILDK